RFRSGCELVERQLQVPGEEGRVETLQTRLHHRPRHAEQREEHDREREGHHHRGQPISDPSSPPDDALELVDRPAARHGHGHAAPPEAIRRATRLTTSVTANSTKPVASSRLTSSPCASGKRSAMLAAMVFGFSGPIRLTEKRSAGDRIIATAMVSPRARDRKSTRLNSSHVNSSYAVFCL